MNSLLNWFLRFRLTKSLLDMADEIATRCHDEVCQRVWISGRLMPLAEARGYVRVRARRVIRREVEAALYRQTELRPRQREQLVVMTLQRVVANTVADLSRASAGRPQRRAA